MSHDCNDDCNNYKFISHQIGQYQPRIFAGIRSGSLVTLSRLLLALRFPPQCEDLAAPATLSRDQHWQCIKANRPPPSAQHQHFILTGRHQQRAKVSESEQAWKIDVQSKIKSNQFKTDSKRGPQPPEKTYWTKKNHPYPS